MKPDFLVENLFVEFILHCHRFMLSYCTMQSYCSKFTSVTDYQLSREILVRFKRTMVSSPIAIA